MKNLGRSLTALAAVVSILGPGGQHSAFADDADMIVSGSGTITPGLSTTRTAQTVTFCGTGTVVPGSHIGSYDFCFNGAGNGTSADGNYCGQLTGDVAGRVCFSVNGNVVTVSGDDVDYDGRNGWIRAGLCVWLPTSINPTTSYNMHCVWTLAHA